MKPAPILVAAAMVLLPRGVGAAERPSFWTLDRTGGFPAAAHAGKGTGAAPAEEYFSFVMDCRNADGLPIVDLKTGDRWRLVAGGGRCKHRNGDLPHHEELVAALGGIVDTVVPNGWIKKATKVLLSYSDRIMWWIGGFFGKEQFQDRDIYGFKDGNVAQWAEGGYVFVGPTEWDKYWERDRPAAGRRGAERFRREQQSGGHRTRCGVSAMPYCHRDGSWHRAKRRGKLQVFVHERDAGAYRDNEGVLYGVVAVFRSEVR